MVLGWVWVLVATSLPSDGPSETAERLASEAIKHHAAGRLREAAEAFLSAYKASGIHIQLRNAAKSYSEAGIVERAIPLWEQVRDHPKASAADRKEAEMFLEILRAEQTARTEQLRQAEPPKQAQDTVNVLPPPGLPPHPVIDPPPPAPIPIESTPSERLVSPPTTSMAKPNTVLWWVAGGLAAGAIIAGGVLLASSRADLRDLDDALAQRQNEQITGISREEAEARLSSIRRDHGIAAALLGLGGAGLLASSAGLVFEW